MKSKASKLAILSVLAVLGMTACGQNNEEEEPNGGEQQVETKELKSVSLNHETLTIEEEEKAEIILAVEQTGLKSNEITTEWDTDNYEVATIQGVGLKRTIRAEGHGQTTLTVTVRDVVNDKTLTATCAITVTEKDRTVHVTSVTLNKTEATLTIGSNEVELLRATIAPANATNQQITWTSSHPEVATVENGLVTAVAGSLAGRTTTITAKSNDDPTKYAECVITVIDTFVAVEKVEITSEDTHFVSENGQNTLTLQSVDRRIGLLSAVAYGANNSTPTNAGISWSVVQGDTLISVSSDGQVTVLVNIPYDGQQQTAKVRATSLGDQTKYAECDIVILPAEYRDETIHVEDDGISFAQNTPSKIETNKTVNIEIVFSNATQYRDITFEIVSNTAAGTVGAKLTDNIYTITTGASEGAFTLRATSVDNPNATVEKTFTIWDKVTHITDINLGDLDEYKTSEHPLVIYTDSDQMNLASLVSTIPSAAADSEHTINTALRFESSGSSIIVTSDGKLSANSVGTGTITITSVQDPDVYKQIYVQVKGVVIKRIETGLPNNEKTLETNDPDNRTFTLTPVVYHGRDGVAEDERVTSTDVSYVSSEPSVATVDANGKVTAVGSGNATITIRSNVDTSITRDVSIHVLEARPKIMTLSFSHTFQSYESVITGELNETDGIYNKSSLNKVFFEDENNIYKVGNQGEFKFKPVVSAFDEAGTASSDYQGFVSFEKSLSIKDGDNWTPLSESEASNYVTFTDEGLTLKNAAIGNTFRLSYSVKDNDAYRKSTTINALPFEFKAIEAYNAYDVYGLSIFDNTNSNINWTNHRSQHGVPEGVTGGIVLHDDISVASSILPQDILWNKTDVDTYITGNSEDFANWKNTIDPQHTLTNDDAYKQLLYNTPFDCTTLFSRVTSADSRFVLEGNFFTINSSTLKQVVKGSAMSDKLDDFAKDVGSAAQLFGINLHDKRGNNGIVEWNNLQMFGNGSIATTDKVKLNLAKGGLIGLKSSGCDTRINNLITHGAFTGLQNDNWANGSAEGGQNDNSKLTVSKTIGYDFYNSAFYFWGSKHNTISDSWFSTSGGPLMLLDEHNRGAWSTDPTERNFLPVEVNASNTYLNNPIVGDEPWFVNHTGADLLVSQMLVAQGLSDGFVGGYSATVGGKSMINQVDSKKFVNFLAIVVNADKFGDNVYGNLNSKIVLTNPDDTGELDMSKHNKIDVGGGIKAVRIAPTDDNPAHDTYAASPFFGVSSNGGYGYVDVSSGSAVPTYSPDGKFTKSNYMGYYLDPVLAQSLLVMQTTGSGSPAFDGYCVGVLLKMY